MLRSELVKLRVLPLPRWALAVAAGILLLITVALVLSPPTHDADYLSALMGGVGIGVGIGGMVFAAWTVGVEFAQGTLRRTLAAVPGRDELVAVKLGVALGGVAAATLAACLLVAPLAGVAAGLGGGSADLSNLFPRLAENLVLNLLYATVAFGVTLLTRSMAGGLVAALGLVFVVDPVLVGALGIEEVSFNDATSDLAAMASGIGEAGNEGRSVGVSAMWLALALAPGWLRLRHGDIT